MKNTLDHTPLFSLLTAAEAASPRLGWERMAVIRHHSWVLDMIMLENQERRNTFLKDPCDYIYKNYDNILAFIDKKKAAPTVITAYDYIERSNRTTGVLADVSLDLAKNYGGFIYSYVVSTGNIKTFFTNPSLFFSNNSDAIAASFMKRQQSAAPKQVLLPPGISISRPRAAPEQVRAKAEKARSRSQEIRENISRSVTEFFAGLKISHHSSGAQSAVLDKFRRNAKKIAGPLFFLALINIGGGAIGKFMKPDPYANDLKPLKSLELVMKSHNSKNVITVNPDKIVSFPNVVNSVSHPSGITRKFDENNNLQYSSKTIQVNAATPGKDDVMTVFNVQIDSSLGAKEQQQLERVVKRAARNPFGWMYLKTIVEGDYTLTAKYINNSSTMAVIRYDTRTIAFHTGLNDDILFATFMHECRHAMQMQIIKKGNDTIMKSLVVEADAFAMQYLAVKWEAEHNGNRDPLDTFLTVYPPAKVFEEIYKQSKNDPQERQALKLYLAAFELLPDIHINYRGILSDQEKSADVLLKMFINPADVNAANESLLLTLRAIGQFPGGGNYMMDEDGRMAVDLSSIAKGAAFAYTSKEHKVFEKAIQSELELIKKDLKTLAAVKSQKDYSKTRISNVPIDGFLSVFVPGSEKKTVSEKVAIATEFLQARQRKFVAFSDTLNALTSNLTEIGETKTVDLLKKSHWSDFFNDEVNETTTITDERYRRTLKINETKTSNNQAFMVALLLLSGLSFAREQIGFIRAKENKKAQGSGREQPQASR